MGGCGVVRTRKRPLAVWANAFAGIGQLAVKGKMEGCRLLTGKPV